MNDDEKDESRWERVSAWLHSDSDSRTLKKGAFVGVLIAGILCMHYITSPEMKHSHAVYRMFFYIPLILGSIWFGLKGALIVWLSISVLYSPHVFMQWKGFAYDDFHKVLEGVLFFGLAVLLGALVERERTKQKALVRTERLAAIGKAVSEIAHDMKTPLMAIGGFTAQALKKLDQGDSNRKKLEIVINETARMENMVKDMLEFGKPLALDFEESNLNSIILDSIEITRPMATKVGVSLRTDLDTSLPPVLIDLPKIKQVLLNLISNGIQASSSGGEVLTKTRLAKRFVILEVADCGCGISEENFEHIFEPFFSKKVGGTGLGLSIVKKIVEGHGGNISLHSNAEKGVTFTVNLPVAIT